MPSACDSGAQRDGLRHGTRDGGRLTMPTYSIMTWTGTALALWFTFTTEIGSAVGLAAVTALAVLSRLASGNLLIFFLATGFLALTNSNLASEQYLQAVYLPLYVMASAIYLLCFLVFIAPQLGQNTGGPGTGVGGGGDGGGGGC